MNISIGVVADGRRGDAGVTLGARIEAGYVSIDSGTLGCLGNHVAVWRWHLSQPADWHLTVEDDAEPVADFGRQLTAALDAAPAQAAIVSLYLGSGYIDDPRMRALVDTAQRNDVCWIATHGRVLHAVALAVRDAYLSSVVDHLARNTIRPIDQWLSRWARLNARVVAYSASSLCDHADGRSLVRGYKRAPRKAFAFGGRDQWNDRVIWMT